MDIEINDKALAQNKVLRSDDANEFLCLGSCDLIDSRIEILTADADEFCVLVRHIHLLLEHGINIVQNAVQYLFRLLLVHIFIDSDACQHLSGAQDDLALAERINIAQEFLLFFCQRIDVSCQFILCLFKVLDFSSGLFNAGLRLIIRLLHGGKFIFHIDSLAFDAVKFPGRFFRLSRHVLVLLVPCLELELA